MGKFILCMLLRKKASVIKTGIYVYTVKCTVAYVVRRHDAPFAICGIVYRTPGKPSRCTACGYVVV